MALTKPLTRISALIFRPQSALAKTHLTTSTVVCSQKKKLPSEDFDEYGFPDHLDLAMGMHRKELIARLAGVEDPYSIGGISRENKGTKLEPIQVPSALESRMIACRCSDDTHTLLYMWLHQNEVKRCRCGYYMTLFFREPFVEYSWPY